MKYEIVVKKCMYIGTNTPANSTERLEAGKNLAFTLLVVLENYKFHVSLIARS